MADKSEETTDKRARRHPAEIPRIFQSKDPATIQADIRNVYGFSVNEQFANDLLAFVEKAMKGDYAK